MFAHEKPGRHNLVARQMIRLEGRGRNQDQLVLHEGLGANAAVACWSFDEPDSQLVLENKLHDLVSVAAVERELDARILVKESSQQTWEKVLRNRGRYSEGQLSRDLAILPTKFLFRLGHECGYLFSVIKQESSLRSKRDAIGGASEEANAEIFFERFDLKRDGGLSKEKVFRRFAKIEMLSNGAKNLETEVFQLCHVMIIPPKRPVRGAHRFLRGPQCLRPIKRSLRNQSFYRPDCARVSDFASCWPMTDAFSSPAGVSRYIRPWFSRASTLLSLTKVVGK
jgi:hypothetical protein